MNSNNLNYFKVKKYYLEEIYFFINAFFYENMDFL
jgi:hypothetical protein